MNILPFVFTLLVVIGILSAAGLSQALSFSKKYATSKAWLDGSWMVYNELQRRLYQQKGGKELEEEEVYFRIKWTGAPASCLNLYSLVRDTGREQPLWEVACRYLERIYTPILPKEKKKKKETIKRFLHLLLDRQQEALIEDQRVLPLPEIELPGEELHQLYYKMLRGTNPYDLLKPEGYPPLQEVIVFCKGKQKPVPFPNAHPVLLEEVLGQEVVAAIIEREKELVFDEEKKKEKIRNTPLKKNELEAVMSELKVKIEEGNLALLSYKSSSKQPPVFWLDSDTRIAMRYFPRDQEKVKENPSKQRKKRSRRRN